MKGLVNCNFLPGSARRLELGTVSAEPLSRRSAKRLACRACVLLAKVPIALKRAVGLSGPSTGSAPANDAVRLPGARRLERQMTVTDGIVMPTAPSLERDSAPGGGPLEIRRSIASGTAASSRSRSPRSFHFLSIHLDPITRARARAAATQVGITKVVVSVSAYFFPPLPWFGGPEGAPCPVEG